MREEVLIRDNGSRRVMMHCDQPSLTRQEFQKECDLGLTIKRFLRNGGSLASIENAKKLVSERYDDVTAVPDYRTAFEYVNRADAVFNALPAELRKRFNNDPAQFLQFVDDPKNLDQLIVMGLAKPKPVLEAAPAMAGAPVQGQATVPVPSPVK